MRDIDDEVRQIKKEIVESRGLVIKTNNLVNALGADIKSIAKRQAGYERRLNWNSGVAIAVIGVLSFVGLKLYFDAQTPDALLEALDAFERDESQFVAKEIRSWAEGFGAPRLILDAAAEAWKEPGLLARSGAAVVLPPSTANVNVTSVSTGWSNCAE